MRERNPSAREIGKRLRLLRGGKSAATVAQALGISRMAVWQYENGARVPTDLIKIDIARYYGKPVEELFFLPEE